MKGRDFLCAGYWHAAAQGPGLQPRTEACAGEGVISIGAASTARQPRTSDDPYDEGPGPINCCDLIEPILAKLLHTHYQLTVLFHCHSVPYYHSGHTKCLLSAAWAAAHPGAPLSHVQLLHRGPQFQPGNAAPLQKALFPLPQARAHECKAAAMGRMAWPVADALLASLIDGLCLFAK